ncbi:MAG: hypothetical protein ACLR7Z_21560 [Bilophila wadsworthia]
MKDRSDGRLKSYHILDLAAIDRWSFAPPETARCEARITCELRANHRQGFTNATPAREQYITEARDLEEHRNALQ